MLLRKFRQYWNVVIPRSKILSSFFMRQDATLLFVHPASKTECLVGLSDCDVSADLMLLPGIEFKVIHSTGTTHTVSFTGEINLVLIAYLHLGEDGEYRLKVPELLTIPHVKDRVPYLKALPQPEQRSELWYEIRGKSITASDFGTTLGMNHYNKPEEVLYKKCGLGKPFSGNVHTRHGQMFEDVAIGIEEKRRGIKINEYGLIQHPVLNFIAASPDGITDDGVMYEIKCPTTRTIIHHDGESDIPRHYWAQMQDQLECANLEECYFLQIRVHQYPDRKAYMSDEHPTKVGYTSVGLEKGVLLQWGDLETGPAKFRYGPVSATPEEADSWCNRERFNPPPGFESYKVKVVWWFITEYACDLVKRDQEWFLDQLLIAGKTWDEIQYHRSNACYKLTKRLAEKEAKKVKYKGYKNSAKAKTSNGTRKYKSRMMTLE